jgi:hypothetical protein
VRPSIVSRSWYRRDHRSNERCQLGSRAAFLVIGKLKNRGPLGFSQISPTWIGVRPVGRADRGATYALSKCDRCAVKDPYVGRFLVWLFRDGNRVPLMRLAEYRDSCGPRPTPPAIAPGKGHQRMSCLGHSRRFRYVRATSALPPIATIKRTCRQVGSVPIGDIRARQRLLSCVLLVEQGLGLFQVERLEAFGEPAVDWREEIAGLPRLALIAP